jgi:hypothetical protein
VIRWAPWLLLLPLLAACAQPWNLDDDDALPTDDDDTLFDDDDTVVPDDDDVAPDDDDTTPPELPDVVPVSLDGMATDVTILRGDTISFGYSYANEGEGTAAASEEVPLINRVHLATGTSTMSSVAVLLEGWRTTPLGSGASSFRDVTEVYVDVAPGSYNLVLEVDAEDHVAEADEGNNELLGAGVTVSSNAGDEDCSNGTDDDFDGLVDCDDVDCWGELSCLSDLVPLAATGVVFPLTVQQGQTVQIGYAYENAGGSATNGITESTPLINALHLSESTSLADSVTVLLMSSRSENLNAGQGSSLAAVDVTIGLSPGSYQALLEVDQDDVVAEGNEGNNVLVVGGVNVTAP